MMLVTLLEAPKSQAEWDIWSFSHREHHDQIRQAVQAKNGTNLQDYQLDPIVQGPEWLKRNAQTHQDMNGVLLLQGTDLEGVDFENRQQLEAWIRVHYQEHFDAAASLQI